MLPLLTGCKDDPTQPSAPPVVDSPAAVVGALADAYQALDYHRFARLVAADPAAEFRFEPLGTTPGRWDAVSELYLHRRMFEPSAVPANDPPVPADLRLRKVDVSAVEVAPFAPVTNPPPELDPSHWQLFTGTYDLDAYFDTESPNDYRVGGRAELEVVQDLSKQPGEEGRFMLYSWREAATTAAWRTAAGTQDASGAPTGIEPQSWESFKLLYWQGVSPPSSAALIQELIAAYARLDLERYTALFPGERGDPSFAFVGYGQYPGESTWDRNEELRIHRRMFQPGSPLPGETPVPTDLWLQSITVNLTPLAAFVERPDLYRSETNPGGIDPDRWRAEQATYYAELLFDMQGPNDYRADGDQSFTVLERRDRLRGVPGKYVLDLWEDFGPYALAPSLAGLGPATLWTHVKELYR